MRAIREDDECAYSSEKSAVVPGRPAVFDIDGSPLGSIGRVQFWGGPSADALEPVGAVVNILTAGLWNGGTATVDSVVADGSTPTFIAIEAWIDDGSGGKSNSCFSDTFSGIGGGFDPGNGIVSPPATLNGFTGIICVPEPSTYALAILGAGILFLGCRRFSPNAP